MRRNVFINKETGDLIQVQDDCWAFAPAPLPPKLTPSWEMINQLSAADRALSELAGVARNLPNPHLLIGPFMRQEAVLSSRIEGTQTTLSQLFLFEEIESDELQKSESEKADVREVANYVLALEWGLKQIQDRPISLMLIRQIHHILMQGVRGKDKMPGQFRTEQNFIGPPRSSLTTTTYVPPPPLQMRDSLEALDKYINSTDTLPPLVRAALIHYQFEAIHPFMDGNGRIGRLLMILMLCREEILPRPLLYLSGYFERNRDSYYDLLLEVSTSGAWNKWIEFFLQGVAEQSKDAIRRSDQLLDLRREYQTKLRGIGVPALSLHLLEELFAVPVISVPRMVKRLEKTFHTVQQNVDRLVSAGILKEVTGRDRNRVYVAEKIIEITEV